ncbi:putative membrane protein YphA (DoxX/SURF4 family) [Pedobacter sp. AK017]|uniref:MauE/DoxX family redox-associated membrane protein n=1 Tax=Pedobacter sp. AK017 TaxID=2723073 RepID=UPI001617A8B3|nr:MauE/DoxX family redox-associated membrane protein [Pedobacter sp. AK017]MBB5440092.1 putative membrane protein YphA (DoxX/SURF4 family) [Pedobacter sp. AK017]
MKKETLITLITASLALLFFYAAVTKLMHYEQSRYEMYKQLFARDIAEVLTWLLPVTELLLVLLLLIKSTRLKGLYATLIVLIVFTIYIAVAMSGIFGKKPCACGGVIEWLNYWQHLGLNFFFIVVAALGIALEKQWKPINRWFHVVNGKEGTGLN